jgi:hypothetical protein
MVISSIVPTTTIAVLSTVGVSSSAIDRMVSITSGFDASLAGVLVVGLVVAGATVVRVSVVDPIMADASLDLAPLSHVSVVVV